MATSCNDGAMSGLFTTEAAAAVDYSLLRDAIEQDMLLYEARRRALPAALQPSGAYVQRLKAVTKGASYHKNLTCLMPRHKLSELSRRHSFDRDLLDLKLVRGRACGHALCSLDRCGLHVFDGVVTAAEAAELVAHGKGVLDSEGGAARDVTEHWPYVRVDFMRSARNGSTAGHVLSLRVAERMRRVAAETFGLPLHRLGVAETLLALRRIGEKPMPADIQIYPSRTRDEARAAHAAASGGVGVDPADPAGASAVTAVASPVPITLAERGSERFAAEAAADGNAQGSAESNYHCDESLAPHFHFSSIVWLNEHGADFGGGELEFLHNRTWAWMVVEPAVGRAAFFSSGWENVHGIKPLTRGQRWALSVPFYVYDPPPTADGSGTSGEGEGEGGGSDDGATQAVQRPIAAARARTDRVRFRSNCVHPVDKHAYQACRQEWAASFG